MLASVLPGLRDLRVPLTSGFLWLVAIWLIFRDMIPTADDAAGLAKSIYVLFGALGSAALLATLTFVAYLLGIVLGQASRLVDWFASVTPARAGRSFGNQVSYVSVQQNDLRMEKIIRAPADDYRFTAAAAYTLGLIEGPDKDPLLLSREILGRMRTAAFNQVPLVATRLLARNRELYDRYDRADAEARFRYAISIPLLVLVILVILQGGLVGFNFFLGMLAIAATCVFVSFIIADGSRKQREANDAVYQAVLIGEVEFPVVEEFTAARQKVIEDESRIEEAQRRHNELAQSSKIPIEES